MNITLKSKTDEDYKESELHYLWGILRGKLRTSPVRYTPIGLVAVPFNIPLEGFLEDSERKLNDHVPWVDEVIISFSIDELVSFLVGKEIFFHGLFCGGKFKSAYDTALSIYFDNRNSGNHPKYCFVLPGINYLPPVEKIESWRSKGRLDDSEYQRWIELVNKHNQ